MQGVCGVPSGAKAVSVNVTAVGPAGLGFLTLFPQGTTQPVVSNLNYSAGEPALGPAGFPHRVSSMLNPVAPISHHWLDSSHISFGVVTAGLAWCVASMGLVGCGRTRAGALMLGMSPAVHPAIGVWFGAIAAVALWWGRRDLGHDLRRGTRFFVIGAGATVASLILRLILTPSIAPVLSAETVASSSPVAASAR